jgi:hypothetical protein
MLRREPIGSSRGSSRGSSGGYSRGSVIKLASEAACLKLTATASSCLER